MQLDRTDWAILRRLQNNARLSNKELAAAVSLAPSSCHERVKRLWDEGVITGSNTALNFPALGWPLEALFMIGLSKHARDTVDTMIAEIRTIPEVRSTWLITGRYDLVVNVVARDMTHLKNLAFDHFTSRAVVTRIETSIVFESGTQYALPEDEG